MKQIADAVSCAYQRRLSQERRIHQSGAALVIALFLLVVFSLLGTSAAQLALQGEKAARGDRDRQIALRSAEAALRDAEIDIEHSPDAMRSRSHIFSRNAALGFPRENESRCNAGQDNVYLGLCSLSVAGKPPWQLVNFSDRQSASMHSVPYGHFTGRKLATGKASLPCMLPRYVIERIVVRALGEDAGKPAYVYRVTAIGFGVRESTQVVLQSVYRKGEA